MEAEEKNSAELSRKLNRFRDNTRTKVIDDSYPNGDAKKNASRVVWLMSVNDGIRNKCFYLALNIILYILTR